MLETMAPNLLTALARASSSTASISTSRPTPIQTPTPTMIPTPVPSTPAPSSSTNRVNNPLKRQFSGLYSGGTVIRGKARFKTPEKHRVTDLPVFVLPGPTSITPKGSRELELAYAGLGKKIVPLSESSNHSQIVSMMEEEYPKLKPLMGRWMFYKATGGSGQRKLSVIPIDSEGYSGRQLRLASNNGKNVLFLVPVQEELETVPLPLNSPEFAKMPKVTCNNCAQIVPLQMLGLHVESCQTAPEQTVKIVIEDDDDDDNDDSEADNVDQPEEKGEEENTEATAPEHLLQDNEVPCPICGNMFASADIEAHASDCGQRLEEDSDGSRDAAGPIQSVDDVIHAVALAVNIEKVFGLTVSRHNMVERGLVQWQRQKKSSPANQLKVTFLGEAGVDTGALRKEFLTKMVEGIGDRFFEKGDHGSTPAYSLSDFDKGLFRTVGEIFSASLAQGGPAPSFLTYWCYRYLCLGEIKSEDWKKADVADATYIDLISRIEAAAEPELQELANDVIGCGYSGLISGGKKDEMIRAVILHANLRLLPILQQMKEGLSLFGLGNIMARHPDICRPLFVPGDEVTVDADYINSILLAEHSEEGLMRRAREIAIMQYVQDFLQELEEDENELRPLVPKDPKDILQWSMEHQQEQEQEPDENELRPLCPKDILQWITGQGHIPLIAQEKRKFVITVTFNHDCTSLYGEHMVCYPVVAACTNTITLPVAHIRSIEDFRSVLSKGYVQGQQFSCV